MFRATSSQRSMFGVEQQLDPIKRARMEKTWAHAYRGKALGLIEESRFAKYFDAGNGRPNKSVRLVVSVLLLKEVFDLTDDEALEQLEWNAAWHYALDVLPEEAHTCQKTLHNFRAKLLGDDKGAGLFESTTARLIEASGVKTGRQRQDSTHIVSNIRLLTRLGLFVETVTHFLAQLRQEHPRLCARVSGELLGRYLDREGYFADARGSEAQRRLAETAVDVYWLIATFGEHKEGCAMESFTLLARLYAEQCEPPATETPERIELKEKPSSSSLQSPYDPDATYGHKGKGYEVQLVETCSEENAFEVVTAVSVNDANESDQHQVLPALDQVVRTCGAPPEELHGDAGYGSGQNIIEAKLRGTELLAPIGQKASKQGVTLADFEIDVAGGRVVRCPVGEAPVEHRPTRTGRALLVVFAAARCSGCPLLAQCPTEKRGETRVLRLTPADLAVAQRRVEQETPRFKERHKIRFWIEATNSELKRSHRLGKPRVRRKPQVSLAVRLKVLAMNLKRYVGHLTAQAAAAVVRAPACTCRRPSLASAIRRQVGRGPWTAAPNRRSARLGPTCARRSRRPLRGSPHPGPLRRPAEGGLAAESTLAIRMRAPYDGWCRLGFVIASGRHAFARYRPWSDLQLFEPQADSLHARSTAIGS